MTAADPTTDPQVDKATNILKPPSTPQTRKVSGFRYLPREFFLEGKKTKDHVRNMTANEVDSRAFEMGYDEFMSMFVPCNGDEAKEAEEIENIVKEIGEVPKVLRKVGGIEAKRHTPFINMIRPALEGTGYVARDVHRWPDKSGLNRERRPDIVCYKSTDGTTVFDLPGKDKDKGKAPSDSENRHDTSSTATQDLPPDSAEFSHNNSLSSDDDPQIPSSLLSPQPIDDDEEEDDDEEDDDEGEEEDEDDNPFLDNPTESQSATDGKAEKKKKKKSIPPFAAHMNYNACKLTIEDKTNHHSAAFGLNAGSVSILDFLPDGTEHIRARGQIGEHGTIVMERQHRTHFFSVVTIAYTIRLLRWDRAGVVISEPVNFVKDLPRLIKFFYRFARLTSEQQGEDISIITPDDKDLSALEDFRINHVPALVPNHQEFFHHAFVKHKAHCPIVKIVLDSLPSLTPASFGEHRRDSSKKAMQLLIGFPRTNTYSPFGRGTKGFIAFDLEEKRLKFVKDCWRYEGATYHPELEVYQRIQTRLKQPRGTKSGLATAEGGGDVVNSFGDVQKTATDLLLNTRRKKKLLPQIHYRFVIRQVGTPLEKYRLSSFNLCKHIYEAMKGHSLAWEQAEVAHRDVSPENIMIDEDPEGGSRRNPLGFIHDFDLSKYLEEMGFGQAQEVRSGTWPFVSAVLLYYPSKQHELADDLESFIHVIHWFCLRFHHHNLTPIAIAEKLSTVYFSVEKINGYDLGRENKLDLMQEGRRCFRQKVGQVNDGLRLLVKDLSAECVKHYGSIDFQTLEKERNELLNLEPPQSLPAQPEHNSVFQEPNSDADSDSDSGSGSDSDSEEEEQTTVSPNGNSKLKSKSSMSKTTPSPFINHSKFLKLLKKYLKKPSYWKLQDKIADQFSSVVSHSMYLNATDRKLNLASTNFSTGSKRSSSAVFGESGTEPKRPRTDVDDTHTDTGESSTSTIVPSATRGARRNNRPVKALRSKSNAFTTVPEESDEGGEADEE
ncbi:hypothetical protein C8Q75DRAFT_735495 [Abortiporus biennis]|nr:hypothetical protein C8Q75DRAFT_735495 [Abortiporus biennis]